mmetsp:Transcript_83050/g.173862  ORF Transcript_83050/g.173862 Transcript_83050/m.173862 type:complete len:232 (-) Transcript_83050:364-1059(-)
MSNLVFVTASHGPRSSRRGRRAATSTFALHRRHCSSGGKAAQGGRHALAVGELPGVDAVVGAHHEDARVAGGLRHHHRRKSREAPPDWRRLHLHLRRQAQEVLRPSGAFAGVESAGALPKTVPQLQEKPTHTARQHPGCASAPKICILHHIGHLHPGLLSVHRPARKSVTAKSIPVLEQTGRDAAVSNQRTAGQKLVDVVSELCLLRLSLQGFRRLDHQLQEGVGEADGYF